LVDFKTAFKAAKLPERSVQLCLRGDLVAQHEDLERRLEDLQRSPGDSLAGSGAGAIADRVQALEVEMRDSTVTFTFRAMPRPKWRQLVAEHPPREGKDLDGQLGYNPDSFYPVIIRACVVEPDATDEEWTELLDERLSDNQFAQLAAAAFAVNEGDVNVPFSSVASSVRRSTAGG
jgi:hypothetical protein